LNDPISNDLAQIKNIFKLLIRNWILKALPSLLAGLFFARYTGQIKKQGHFLHCFFTNK